MALRQIQLTTPFLNGGSDSENLRTRTGNAERFRGHPILLTRFVADLGAAIHFRPAWLDPTCTTSTKTGGGG
jgi:hypothetical protein